MILRKPFTPEIFHAKKGWAVGARYTYMIGVANELAVRHIPEIAPRNDTLAGPHGRRADQVRNNLLQCSSQSVAIISAWQVFDSAYLRTTHSWAKDEADDRCLHLRSS